MASLSSTELQNELLKKHSKSNILRVASLIDSDEESFSALMKFYFNHTNMDLARNAAWIMREVASKNIFLIRPYIKKIITYLHRKDLHDAVKRNTLGLFKDMDLEEKWRGPLIDLCFRFLENHREPVAVKAFSMAIIAREARSCPEILNELKLIIENIYPYGSAGFQAQARKILSE